MYHFNRGLNVMHIGWGFGLSSGHTVMLHGMTSQLQKNGEKNTPTVEKQKPQMT